MSRRPSRERLGRVHKTWVQVRLRRTTAARLAAACKRLAEYYGMCPGQAPAFLDGIADDGVSYDRAVMILLWRDDNHSMRSRSCSKTKVAKTSKRR